MRAADQVRHRGAVTSRPARTASGRLPRRALAAAVVVLLAWLVVGGVGGPFTGRLAEVQENDSSAFLPESSESTRVADIAAEFQGGSSLPAVVVWQADGAQEGGAGQVTPLLAAAATDRLSRAGALPDVAGEPVGPLPSADGQALQAVVPFSGDLGGTELTERVEQLRALLADMPDGTAYVTGPAGIFGDFGEAFSEIDGLLLVVALTVVLVILLAVYRSPLLPLLVIVTGVLALGAAGGVVYVMTDAGLLTLNGQSQGILFILVVGAATDYSLLLVARFREELRAAEKGPAMATALRRTVEPVLASGGTVVLGVLCLLASELSSTASLGPVAAVGVVFAMLSALTFLPAALVLLGRAAYWPSRPRRGSPGVEEAGLWGRVARQVARRPRRVWVGVTVVLGLLCLLAPRLDTGGVAQADIFLEEVESVVGQDVLAEHFPAGQGTPALVVGPADATPALLEAVGGVDGVASAVPLGAGPPAGGEPLVVDGRVLLQATLAVPEDEAGDVVRDLRSTVREVSPAALVGGAAAIETDVNDASSRDLRLIVPLVLAVIGVVLALLLRSLLAPLLLVGTVVLSFGATLGVAWVVFEQVLDLPGGDPSIPLFAFVFLGALGIDYNIFLMTRLREEAAVIGTRAATVKALGVTGGVITSAGVVLAATFGALAVLPVLFLLQIAFLVAFGVLLDTLVVRGLLVPGLVHDLGRVVWWPSALARSEPAPRGDAPGEVSSDASAAGPGDQHGGEAAPASGEEPGDGRGTAAGAEPRPDHAGARPS